MAGQPPSRPWFRLASIARPVGPPPPVPQPPPQAPPPAPAPQPRPTISIPTFRPSAPPPPPPQEVPPPPPPPSPSPSPPPPPPPPISFPPSPPPPPPPSVPPTPPRPPVEPLPDVSTGTPTRPTPSPVSSSPLVRTIAAPTPASPAKAPPSPHRPPPPPPAVALSPVKPQVPSAALKSPVSSSPKTAIPMPAQMPMPMPMPSPKVVKPAAQTPPQSPSMKPAAPPPSPLKLPPPQLRADDQPRIPLEAEQKTVLVQETVPPPPTGSRPPSLNGRIHPDAVPKAGIARDTKNGDAERHRGPHPKKVMDSTEVPGMKVITIAGENRGATMELVRSPKHHLLHSKASPTSKSNGHESRKLSSPSSSSDEGKQQMKKTDKSQQSKSFVSPPISAFMNSNVQGVNNSIVYNSSCTHHDPGVHLALSRKPSNGSSHIKDLVKGHQP